jgi:hypothetical protein
MNLGMSDDEAHLENDRPRSRQRQDAESDSALPRRPKSAARRRARNGTSVDGIHRRRRKRMSW